MKDHASNCRHCLGTLFEGKNLEGVKIPCRDIKYETLGEQRRFRVMREAIVSGLYDPKHPEETNVKLAEAAN